MFEAILDKKLNADRGFIKPKRKPPEELERLKRENFERAAPGLENPDEVKQMLGLAYGGIATPRRLGFSEGKLVKTGPNKGKYYFKYGTGENYKTFYAKDLDEGKAWLKKQSTDFKWLKKNIDIKDLEKRVGELAKTGKYTQAELQQVLKNEGYIKPSKINTSNYLNAKTKINTILKQLKIKAPTTGDKQNKVFEKLVKKYPKVNTISGIAELAQKELGFKSPPHTQVKDWAKANNIKLLTINETIFPEIEALDKLVKKNKSLFENIQRGGPGRGPVIINNANAINNSLFSEMKKLGFDITPSQFNARLVKLDALYSGRLEPGTKYATDIYKKIKPIKNYEKSKFKKGLFATVKNSGYTGVLQEAQMLNLPQKDIDLLSDSLKGARELSRVKIAGDHTDSSALMRAVLSEKNWKQYKKDFMRINVISNTLNKVKSPFDRKISDAYKNVQKGVINKNQFNEIVSKTKKELFAKTKIPIGNPKFVNGKFQFNFLTEPMGDISNPRNAAIKTAMNNLVKQSGVNFKGIDQELMFANNTKERFNILKNASLETLQNSKYLKAFANMSGKVGKAANTILKTKTGKVGAVGGAYGLLSTIASADESKPTETDLIDEVALTGKEDSILPEAAIGTGAAAIGSKFTKTDPLKKFRRFITAAPVRKGIGKIFTSRPVVALAGPTAMAGASIGLLANNPSDPMGYAALTGMGASAKLVADKIKTPLLQKALTLGAGPARIAKLARFTTPVGLAATGVASLVNVAREAQKEFDALSPEEQKEYLAEQEQFAEDVNRDEFLSYAGGGIVGIRKPSAIPPEKGPQSQGLDYLRYYGT